MEMGLVKYLYVIVHSQVNYGVGVDATVIRERW